MSGKAFDVEVDVDVEIQFRQCLTFKVQCLNSADRRSESTYVNLREA